MPRHSNKLAKFFRSNGKRLVLGLIFLVVAVVAFLTFQEENKLKSQIEEGPKVNVIRTR